MAFSPPGRGTAELDGADKISDAERVVFRLSEIDEAALNTCSETDTKVKKEQRCAITVSVPAR